MSFAIRITKLALLAVCHGSRPQADAGPHALQPLTAVDVKKDSLVQLADNNTAALEKDSSHLQLLTSTKTKGISPNLWNDDRNTMAHNMAAAGVHFTKTVVVAMSIKMSELKAMVIPGNPAKGFPNTTVATLLAAAGMGNQHWILELQTDKPAGFVIWDFEKVGTRFQFATANTAAGDLQNAAWSHLDYCVQPFDESDVEPWTSISPQPLGELIDWVSKNWSPVYHLKRNNCQLFGQTVFRKLREAHER